MARIPLVDPDDPEADPKARSLLLRLRRRTGRDINVLRALANHPMYWRRSSTWAPSPPPPRISAPSNESLRT